MNWPAPETPVEQVRRALGLEALPDEGGSWAAGPRDAELSGIRYLLTDASDGFSALHRLTVAEAWQWLAGAPSELVRAQGPALTTTVLDVACSQLVVPANTWQGARTLGAWTLVACWCAPGYTESTFALGERSALTQAYPAQQDLVRAFTRTSDG